jgi:hypothetical protein
MIEAMCLACDGPIPRRAPSTQWPPSCFCPGNCRFAWRAAGYAPPSSFAYEDRRMLHARRREMMAFMARVSQLSGVSTEAVEQGEREMVAA